MHHSARTRAVFHCLRDLHFDPLHCCIATRILEPAVWNLPGEPHPPDVVGPSMPRALGRHNNDRGASASTLGGGVGSNLRISESNDHPDSDIFILRIVSAYHTHGVWEVLIIIIPRMHVSRCLESLGFIVPPGADSGHPALA